MFDIKELYSPLARSGEPPYFHKNPPHIVFDFDQGTPDPKTFPAADLVRLAEGVIERDGPAVLDYMDHAYGYGDVTMGWTPLREQIAAYIERRDGRKLAANGVIATNGSVQAIALVATAYLSEGDAVFVEAASFPFGMRYMAQAGAEVVPVAVDGDGMNVDALIVAVDEAKQRGLRPKMIYTIATHQLPTGMVLSLERRRQMLALALEREMLIVEDNVYAAFDYDGQAPPTLLSLDDQGIVIQTDSFSKVVAPGTRVGWAAGTEEAIFGLAMVRQDLGANQWISKVMTDYLAEGLLERQIESVNTVYREKRDVVARELDAHCKPWVDYRFPHGGFYFWLDLAEDVPWERVQELAYEKGIAMRPGEMFMGKGDGRGHLRMSYVHLPVAEIESGIQTFGEVLKNATSSAAAAA
jgi:2-aminoadipate transaminase